MDIRNDFAWRIRANVRAAVNLPYNRTTESQLPSSFVEFGWAQYNHSDINQPDNARSATIDSNRFPVWNNELIYYPPKTVTTLDGFLIFYLRDRFALRPLSRFVIPLNTLRPFHPVHLVYFINIKTLGSFTRY